MTATLTQFRIEGLHGRDRIIDIPIQNNRLVLVGENGIGKSTVANLLYYLLTQQWRRIGEYKLSAIQVSADGETVRLTHEDVDALLEHRGEHFGRDIRRHYPPSVLRQVYRHMPQEFLLFEGMDEDVVERVSEAARVPKSVARTLVSDIRDSQSLKLKKPLVQQLKRLSTWQFGQFLYLPTYRRIEQDLKSIFRGIEIEEKVREFRERFRKRERSTFIELVEFGMEDVDRTIQLRMAQIKESVRTGLSTLTGTYLREVIRGLQDNPDVSVLRSIDPSSFQSMFARIDEAILPASDKKLLQSKILDIAQGYTIGPDDKVIAHFISKLVTLYREQQANESDVRDFVRLCNVYLAGKQIIYDDVKYEIYVSQTLVPKSADDAGEKLELKVLSSGEKQIVSLFSHLYLSGEREFFVVIDEPELSLSVPWQQRFLPDILATGRCTGVVAVTHSPFIWDNQLEPYVRSLAEFIRTENVIH
jgi:energy-coupling factor transporter ATP-binding protein EcfA2